MAALDFPNVGITTGTTYIGDNGVVYVYDGVKWAGSTTGTIGATGPQGPQGVQGEVGPTGPSGPNGADSTVSGPQGPQGAQGPSGSIGPQGVQGPQGSAGPTGPSGPSGFDSIIPGPQGPQGVQGEVGPTGPSGAAAIGGTVFDSTITSMAFYSSTSTIRGAGGVDWNSLTETFQIGSNLYPNVKFVHFSGTYSGVTSPPISFIQTHNTADSSNIQFTRNRGLALTPTSVQAGDDVMDIIFSGRYEYYTTASTIHAVAGMSVIVESTATTVQPVGKISYFVNDGTTFNAVAELTSSTWKVNRLSALTGSQLTIDSKLISTAGLEFPDGTTQTTAFVIGSAPVNSTSTGAAGTLAYDESFMYVCTATNAWQRISWDVNPW